MKKLLNITLGSLLILGSLVGLVFSVTGIVLAWRAKPEITGQINQAVILVNNSLDATDEMLSSISLSLDQTAISLEGLQAIARTTATTLNDSTPALDSVAVLVGEDMVKIINDTQTSLDSVQSSAQLIDDTLMVISSIPLIGAKYAPDIPLSTSIAQMSSNLDPLPDGLKKVQEDLETASDDLHTLQDNVRSVGDNVDDLIVSLDQIQPVIEQYQLILDDLRVGVDNLEILLIKWLTTGFWAVTVLLIWIGIAQVGLLTQGVEYLTRKSA